MDFLLKPLSFVLIIVIGYTLTRIGFFKEGDYKIVIKIMMTVTLPMAILHSLDGYEPDISLLLVIFLGFVCTFVPILLAYFITAKKDKSSRIVFMLSSGGYNIGCFTLPVIQSFFGPFGAVCTCMFDIGNSVMMSGGSYAFTSTLLHIDTGGEKATAGEKVWTFFKKFLTSVPFDTYMLVLLIIVFGIKIPGAIMDLTRPIANANSFFAMLMIGMTFRPAKSPEFLKEMSKIVLYRLCIAVCFSFLIYNFAPFAAEVRTVLSVVVFGPISVLAPTFTEKCRGNLALASFANSVTIACSMVIMSTLVYFLGG